MKQFTSLCMFGNFETEIESLLVKHPFKIQMSIELQVCIYICVSDIVTIVLKYNWKWNVFEILVTKNIILFRL